MPQVQTKPRQRPNRLQAAKGFNERVRYIQGFRNTVNASAITPFTITLNSVAKFLLGISIMPVSGLITTLADTQVSLVVNNNNLLLNVGANSCNPNFVGDMIFFPTPQPLFGNDNIILSFTKNDATSPVVIYNFYYLPQLQKVQ